MKNHLNRNHNSPVYLLENRTKCWFRFSLLIFLMWGSGSVKDNTWCACANKRPQLSICSSCRPDSTVCKPTLLHTAMSLMVRAHSGAVQCLQQVLDLKKFILFEVSFSLFTVVLTVCSRWLQYMQYIILVFMITCYLCYTPFFYNPYSTSVTYSFPVSDPWV